MPKFIALILRIILTTIFFSTILYYTNSQFKIAIDQKIEWLFPCKSPITYSIDTVDPKFGVTRDEFITMVKTGEGIWEKAIDRDLFEYAPEGGKVSINLIYDDRQAATDKLKKLGYVIDNDKASYASLKSKYDTLAATIKTNKASLEAAIAELKRDQDNYSAEVARLNARGGASKSEYTKLEQERSELNTRASNLSTRQDALNQSVDTLNSLGTVINGLIKDLNLDVAHYNDNQSNLGDEFDQGEYRLDETGRSINIYQFDNKQKLERVMTHELGHALGLGHNNNPKSIMYKINQNTTLDLSSEDISALKAVCHIK